MKRLAWSLLALFVLSAGLAPLPAQQTVYRPDLSERDIDAGLRTDWYGVYLQGKKIGHVRTSRERLADGVRESFRMHLKLFSFGQKAEMTLSQELVFDLRAPHALLRGEYKEDAGPASSRFTYERTGPGTYDVVQFAGGGQRKKTVKDVDYTLADTLATEVWMRGRPSAGAEVTTREFEPKEQRIESQWSKVLGAKTSLVGGVEVRFYEVESESRQDKIRVVARHDETGRMLSGKIAIFELRLEPEEQARNTEFSQDLFVLGMVKVERPLGPIRRVSELVLEVGGADNVFEEGPRQSVAAADGKQLLRVGKRFGKEVRATPEEIAENLRETSAYHLGDPKVVALAKKAVEGAVDEADKVRRLTRFVHDYIRPTFSNSLPAVHDLIERRRGDCKAYALLFANLARAAGVPAREVSGLLYIGDDARAFGGHAWNEVVLDGIWVPIDATFDETEINATHLCFGTDKRAAKNLLETIGKLSLRVVEVNGVGK